MSTDTLAAAQAELIRRRAEQATMTNEQQYQSLINRPRTAHDKLYSEARACMSLNELVVEYERLLRDGSPATEVEKAADTLRLRRIVARGPVQKSAAAQALPTHHVAQSVEDLEVKYKSEGAAEIIPVRMHGDDVVERWNEDRTEVLNGPERWSDRIEPCLQHDGAEDAIDDSERDDCGELGAALSAASGQAFTSARDRRNGAGAGQDFWSSVETLDALLKPEPKPIDPLTQTSIEFWSKPQWRGTNNATRWRMFDESYGRVPPPPEQRP